MNVFYRSQMGRSCPITGFKCPLLSITNGLKDLQSSVIRLSITVTPASNLQCWCRNTPLSCCITSSVKSFSSTSTPRIIRVRDQIQIHDMRYCRYPQPLARWCSGSGMLLQFNTATIWLHSSVSFPPLIYCWVFTVFLKKRKRISCLSLQKKQNSLNRAEPDIVSCIRDKAASLQDAVLRLVWHRRGDRLSECQTNQRFFRPVYMYVKQFVSLCN